MEGADGKGGRRFIPRGIRETVSLMRRMDQIKELIALKIPARKGRILALKLTFRSGKRGILIRFCHTSGAWHHLAGQIWHLTHPNRPRIFKGDLT